MKKTVFIKNAAVLTATSLLLRFFGVIIKVWLAATIGSEGIGLYQLVFSFYFLAATFATSGICTAVTRLVTDELCIGSQISIKRIMRSSLFLTVCVALLSNTTVFFFADPISKHIIGDSRAVGSLRILSFSLVFMGITSCLRGYFIARRKAVPPSSSQIIEHLIRIISIILLVKRFAPFGIEYACYGVFLSDLIAESAACFYLYFFYKHDSSNLSSLSGRNHPNYGINQKIWHIAAPITGGKYINSMLRTAENALVPARLIRSGLNSSAALSSFGMIKGMVLPVLFFPSSLLSSFSMLLIPELSEARSKGQNRSLCAIIDYTLRITAIFGFLFGAIFFAAGEEIGLMVYKDAAAGNLIVRLAPIVPLMYLDSTADGMLKGMDQQLATFVHSVSDSALRIILVLLLLGNHGLDGFVWIMYFSNTLTCVLNVIRLLRCSKTKIKLFKGFVFPLISSATIAFAVNNLLCRFSLPIISYIILLVAITSSLYFAVLLFTKCITISSIKRLR